MTVSVTIYHYMRVPSKTHSAFELACRLRLNPSPVLVDTVFTHGQRIRSMITLSLCWMRINSRVHVAHVNRFMRLRLRY